MGALIGGIVSIAWQCAVIVAVADVVIHGFGIMGAVGT